MKKIIVIALSILCNLWVTGQNIWNYDTKGHDFSWDVGYEDLAIANNSHVSLFAGGDEQYEHVSSGFVRLMYKRWVLEYNLLGMETGARLYDETTTRHSLTIGSRENLWIGEKTELVAVTTIGLLIAQNLYEYQGERHTVTRGGLAARGELGINWHFSEQIYYGLRCTYCNIGTLLGERPSLPTGLVANHKRDYYLGTGFAVVLGFRF